MTALSPELHWAASCLRSLSTRVTPPVPPPLHWKRALAIAEAEGVAPALGFVFRAEAPPVMPVTVSGRLRQLFVESTARQLVFTRELGRLLDALTRAGIPVIPLKGPALAEAVYAHPGVRPCTDLDLLIRRADLGPVDDLLRGLGYRRLADAHSFHFDLAYDRATLYAGPLGIHVDLHWGLVNDPRYSWDECEGLTVWDRAVAIRVAGTTALGLSPEDLLLYLATHLSVHHALAGLLWYYDLHLVIERWEGTLDWEALIARASRWRVRAALYFALLGAAMLFDANVPRAVMAEIEPRGPRAAATGWLLRHRTPEQRRRLDYLIALLLVDRGRDLLGTLRCVLLPPPAWLRARYEGVGGSLLRHYRAHYRRLGQIVYQAIGGHVDPRRRRQARDRNDG